MIWFLSFRINNKTIGSVPRRCKRRLFLFGFADFWMWWCGICMCVGCQYMCFFSPLATFFFHSIRLHFYISTFAILFAHFNGCEQEMKIYSTFLRGINEYERQKSVKRKIEGSTSPHPSNKHVTNTLKFYITIMGTHTTNHFS